MKSIGIASRIASLAAAAVLAVPLAANAQSNNRWEGFYAGVNAGGIWSSTAATIGENQTSGGFNGSGSGFMGGAQVGYNYLLGRVKDIEANMSVFVDEFVTLMAEMYPASSYNHSAHLRQNQP